jgi:predicted Fe-S protein YdhL (DUF1289 family)
MTQVAPTSPCLNICVLDAARTCVGCGRTLDEIARWGRMSAAEQWQVIARLERVRQQEAAAASPVPAN